MGQAAYLILSKRSLDGRRKVWYPDMRKGSGLRHQGAARFAIPDEGPGPRGKKRDFLLSDAAKVPLLPYLEFYRICTEDTL